MSQKRNRGRQVKAEAARLIETKMREKGFSGREQLALEIGLTTKTLDKFFLPEKGSPQRNTVETIASFLELNPADLVEDWYPPGSTSEVEESVLEAAEKFKLNYRQICKEILREKIKKLTTTPLTNNDGTALNLDDIYVPLGLVEAKKKPGKGGDISAEMGGQFYEYADYEVTRKFENNQFFDEVIAKGETPKSQGRKIAIVGEPGAGKTTLLQKIGYEAFKNPDGSVAIWISLAELKGKTVEEYLLQVWLKSALKVTRVTPDLEDALEELFNEGKVWLLLDGVDEIGVNNSLGAIASQISGWVASARIILTCRLNVWDAGKNDLYSFDVYRNLDFNEGQIEQFIGKWFDENLKSGKSLLTELKKPGKERIRDLIKNPLRLTMLCWFWQRREGSLPETKAELYRRFVEVFYEWKDWQPDPFSTKSDAQKALEKAFGELAKKAIDESSSRFRLTRRQVCDVLGEPDEPLFDLAKRLGWLNLVGVAEENKDEPVYAFFHPTFQEYFAALNIDDWDFFLPREHNNSNPQPVNGKKYRIFDAQWKEVILLWLGREDVEKEDKEEFIQALAEFEDGCGEENFYGYRAFFLAAAGIAEFKNCDSSMIKAIVKKMVIWSCSLRWRYSDPLSSQARKVLLETNQNITVDVLTYVLRNNQSPIVRLLAATSLVEINSDNTEAIATLVNLTGDDEIVALFAARVLLSIDPENADAKEILEPDLLYEEHEKERQEYLQNIYEENSETIDNLVLELCFNSDNIKRLQVAQNLKQIFNLKRFETLDELIKSLNSDSDVNGKNNNYFYLSFRVLKEVGQLGFQHPDAIAYIIEILKANKLLNLPSNTDHSLLDDMKIEYNTIYPIPLVEILGEIGNDNQDALNILNQLLVTDFLEKVKHQAAISLGKINPENFVITRILTGLLQNFKYNGPFSNYEELQLLKPAATILLKIQKSTILETVVTELKNSLQDSVSNQYSLYNNKHLHIYEVIWHCAQNMTYPEFYYAWHGDSIQTLEKQVVDIPSQLQPTDKTYPIPIDAYPLQNETDKQEIAQELCNQIYQKLFPKNDNIPTVNNASQLKRLIPQIKTHLNAQNIALILHHCEPNPSLIKFCHKLSNAVSIAWLTDAPLEPPLRGFPPNQINLKSALETWLNELE